MISNKCIKLLLLTLYSNVANAQFGIFPIEVVTQAPTVSPKPPKMTRMPITDPPITAPPITVPPVTVPTDDREDTIAPDTTAPDTTAPDTTAPDTMAPDTAAPLTDDEEDRDDSEFLDENGFVLCFPGDATVQVQTSGETNKMISMKNLQIGDMVRVQGNDKYEPVYSFGHKNTYDTAEFMEVETSSSNTKLLLSAQHMVWEVTQEKFIPASEVRRGHVLEVSGKNDSMTAEVTTVRANVRKQGMYAPFTASGTIVVNGIVASSFVAIPILKSVSNQWIAHTGEFPHRFICHYMGSCANNETYDENGINQNWCVIPLQFIDWFFSTSNFVQWILVTLIFTTLSIFSIMEQVLVQPILGLGVIVLGTVMMTPSLSLGIKAKKQL